MKHRTHSYLLKGLLLLPVLFLFTQCHVARYFYWNVANIDDYQKFDNDTILTNNPKTVFSYNEQSLQLPEKYRTEKHQSLDKFLKDHKSVSFAFIVNDTIWKEAYFNEYKKGSPVTSFSVAKSFVATLTGIAWDEGYIESIDDPVIKYLPYLDKADFEGITIRHLLDMRSGLKANEGYYNPFGDVAKYYYGTNLQKYLTQVKKKSPPDQYFEYLSVNTQLLADVVEKATGKPIQQYLEEKIWQPLGMESEALWSVDSKKNNKVKAFCCLSAQTMDFARFGRLYLNNGKWNGEQVVTEKWIEETTNYDSTNIDWQNYPYSKQWRVTRYGAFFAKGIKGQYIYVYPAKGLVAVRFGKSYDDIDWADFLRHLAEKNIPQPKIEQ
ncbi:MAG TPA: serine hydrolase [Bacteroidales bacterium]|nr:serine hydrolase [Bacteroidales bacterium]